MTGISPRSGRTAILAGVTVLWVSALLAIPLAGGDCGGTIDTCEAARARASDGVRLLAIVVVVVSVAAVASLRIEHRFPSGVLLAGGAVMAALGLWAAVAPTGGAWLPLGFVFTLPAALLLTVGGYQRLTGVPRDKLPSHQAAPTKPE